MNELQGPRRTSTGADIYFSAISQSPNLGSAARLCGSSPRPQQPAGVFPIAQLCVMGCALRSSPARGAWRHSDFSSWPLLPACHSDLFFHIFVISFLIARVSSCSLLSFIHFSNNVFPSFSPESCFPPVIGFYSPFSAFPDRRPGKLPCTPQQLPLLPG